MYLGDPRNLWLISSLFGTPETWAGPLRTTCGVFRWVRQAPEAPGINGIDAPFFFKARVHFGGKLKGCSFLLYFLSFFFFLKITICWSLWFKTRPNYAERTPPAPTLIALATELLTSGEPADPTGGAPERVAALATRRGRQTRPLFLGMGILQCGSVGFLELVPPFCGVLKARQEETHLFWGRLKKGNAYVTGPLQPPKHTLKQLQTSSRAKGTLSLLSSSVGIWMRSSSAPQLRPTFFPRLKALGSLPRSVGGSFFGLGSRVPGTLGLLGIPPDLFILMFHFGHFSVGPQKSRSIPKQRSAKADVNSRGKRQEFGVLQHHGISSLLCLNRQPALLLILKRVPVLANDKSRGRVLLLGIGMVQLRIADFVFSRCLLWMDEMLNQMMGLWVGFLGDPPKMASAFLLVSL